MWWGIDYYFPVVCGGAVITCKLLCIVLGSDYWFGIVCVCQGLLVHYCVCWGSDY